MSEITGEQKEARVWMDLGRLSAVMRELEAEQKVCKKVYRDPTKQPSASKVRRDLADNKRKLTFIYMSIAASRGRVHRHGDTPEEQMKLLEYEYTAKSMVAWLGKVAEGDARPEPYKFSLKRLFSSLSLFGKRSESKSETPSQSKAS